MPGDSEMSMPSLADLVEAMRAKKQRPGSVSVRVGEPTVQMAPMRIPVRAQQSRPRHAQAQQGSMDPRAARMRALMSQGLSFEQAMRKVQAGG